MTISQKVSGFFHLIRPELPLAAAMCVVLGQVIALGGLPPAATVGLGLALGFFLSSSAMVFNDYFDLAVDRINAPTRPYPAGVFTQGEMIALGAVTALLGLGVAWVIGPLAFGLSLLAWLLGFVYNGWLKSAGLWGNLLVSTNVAMTFLLGGVSVSQAGGLPVSPLVWAFALIAFCFDLAEEIAGDAMDMEGDRQRGSQSLALRFGKAAALRVSGLLFVLTVALTLVPVVLGETRLTYLIPVGLMDVIILVFTARLLRSQTPAEGRRAMRVLYLSASLGLLAFLLSSVI